MWNRNLAEWVLIAVGIFLAVDKFLLGAMMFNYSMLGIGWLDPYVCHGWMGIMFIAIGFLGLGNVRKVFR